MEPRGDGRDAAGETTVEPVVPARPRDHDNALESMWTEFKADGSRDARNRLVVHFSPLVKYVAGRLHAGLPNNVEQADLVSYGMFGLMDAIEKFEPSRGLKFETYAMSRIRGSIIDELRSIDWVPRSMRAKAKTVERAFTKLEHDLARNPTDAEVAAEMGTSESDLQDLYAQISFFGLVALEETMSAGVDREESVSLRETIADPGPGPGGLFEVEETKQVLAAAINRLPDREKIVLTLYYYEGLTLAQIGEVIGITESRVCQIHTKAVIQLRSKLAGSRQECA